MLKTPFFTWLFMIVFLHGKVLPPENWIEQFNSLSNPKNAFAHQSSNLLFEHYPQLKEQIPYIQLATLPTPIEKLTKMSEKYGIELYIKRDDLTAHGKSLYGGNKIRKLEFLLAQAQACGAQKVLTFGAAGSNHALATAAHAQRLGMKTICMLKPQANSDIVKQNLLLHLKYNSELHYSPNDEIRNNDSYALCVEYLKNDGKIPYIIPTGGANIFGTLGFVNAAFELNQQIKQGLCPKPTHIYVACGSCGTAAGLLLGCKALGLDVHIIAIAVEPDHTNHCAKTIAQLFDETNHYLHDFDESFPLCSYSHKDLTIDFSCCGPDYGIFTELGNKATQEMLTLESIPLDGTYTAKAFAGLLATAPAEQNAIILFWNTYYSPISTTTRSPIDDYHKLPSCFHEYFSDL